MNPLTPNPADRSNAGGFDSRDCQIIIDDGPGDSTVRPPSPEYLKWKMAERERLAKLGFNLDGTPMNPSDGNERK